MGTTHWVATWLATGCRPAVGWPVGDGKLSSWLVDLRWVTITERCDTIARLCLDEYFILFVRIASLAFLLLEVELILTGSIINVSSNIVIAIKTFYRCWSYRFQWTRLLYLVAWICDSFGNGCLADFALAQGLQNLGFESRSRLMPVIKFWVTAYCIVEWALCPNLWCALLMLILVDAMFAWSVQMDFPVTIW
jgi:hypothetical protein